MLQSEEWTVSFMIWVQIVYELQVTALGSTVNWLAALLRIHVSAINEIVLLHDVHYGIS